MSRRATIGACAIALILALAQSSPAEAGRGSVVAKTAKAPKTAKAFIKSAKLTKGTQFYVRGLRVSKGIGRVLGKWSSKRKLVHVDNKSLDGFINATKKGYLEVVIPANTGHVWFRHGEKLYDFGPKGFRVSGVREITKERYGTLVRLDAKQEANLQHYLERLETTKGAELGLYSFKGDKGFHCVSWLMRHSFGEGNFVKMLGGTARDARNMPNFSRFMVKGARNVEAVVVYNKDNLSSAKLDKQKFDLMSLLGLRKAFAETGRPD